MLAQHLVVGAGLQVLRRHHIVHRDLKPEVHKSLSFHLLITCVIKL
jgi:hypothetical protein